MFGREWENEDLLNKYRKNSRKMFKIDLAVESYVDDRGAKSIPKCSEMFELTKAHREKRTILGEKDLVADSEEVLVKLYKDLEELGKDHFIFYEDGTVEYIWNYELLEKNKTKKIKT